MPTIQHTVSDQLMSKNEIWVTDLFYELFYEEVIKLNDVISYILNKSETKMF